MARVLVTYATRYGSTRDVALAISEALSERGFDVDVLSPTPQLDVTKYDAVVVGSPSYGQNWLPSASLFVVGNGTRLARLPVALFTVGTLGVKNPKMALREHEQIVSSLTGLAAGVAPVSTALFHGSFDRKNLPLCLRVMDMLAGTPQGDHRDWAAVRSWGDRVGELFVDRLEANEPGGDDG